MPLVRIHVFKGRSVDELQTLLDVAHDVVVEAFGVPRPDRYQILEEHEKSHLQVLDTGLGMDRSERFVLFEIITRVRSRTMKLVLYETLARSLRMQCGIDPSDVMVSIVENSDEDWSFGMGRAQFMTGELTASKTD
ncbi:tautomerase family protein [Rhizobiaceae bacterium n13]|uniref:Tautomerase family protein n=1 Tax=Ferirhizobium litorale TaxID=2927786 RepID=A0AAE3QF20_9HYPH|nr:tautomerase family protein [Fererhizobium litorale]MDI7865259.1 tautomerase family protein [Fererhizobium litorale]MDI7922131.1 tautomerase family protein [Fererhizobium litorale]